MLIPILLSGSSFLVFAFSDSLESKYENHFHQTLISISATHSVLSHDHLSYLIKMAPNDRTSVVYKYQIPLYDIKLLHY